MAAAMLLALCWVSIILIPFSRADTGLECDFEQTCPWKFEPENGGFRVVSGKEKSGKSGRFGAVCRPHSGLPLTPEPLGR